MNAHLFSYVLTHDSGFAPNPFGGFLTLATCKPQIRRHARKGDYVIGTGSAATVGNHKLVYAALVADIVSVADYGASPDYEIKHPSARGEWWRRHGDNIYSIVDGQWQQRRNVHHGSDAMDHDIGGKNVLVCNSFWYFGEDAVDIPPRLRGVIKKGPGHKRITDESQINAFVKWLQTMPDGICGTPQMEQEHRIKRCAGSGRGPSCGKGGSTRAAQ